MKRFNGSYVAALKTLSGRSGHLHPELVHAFDEKSDDSYVYQRKITLHQWLPTFFAL